MVIRASKSFLKVSYKLVGMHHISPSIHMCLKFQTVNKIRYILFIAGCGTVSQCLHYWLQQSKMADC